MSGEWCNRKECGQHPSIDMSYNSQDDRSIEMHNLMVREIVTPCAQANMSFSKDILSNGEKGRTKTSNEPRLEPELLVMCFRSCDLLHDWQAAVLLRLCLLPRTRYQAAGAQHDTVPMAAWHNQRTQLGSWSLSLVET